MSSAGVGSAAEQALSKTTFAAVVVEVDSGRVVAASPLAASVLDPERRSVVGALFEDFTDDEPLGARELFQSGRVTGFEAVRVISRPGGGFPVRVWIHRFDHEPPNEYVLIMLVPEDGAGCGGRPDISQMETEGLTGVAGTADELLQLRQVSAVTTPLFGLPSPELVGLSILSMVVPADRARVLAGIAEAAETGCGVTLYVDVNRLGSGPAGVPSGCELLVLPLSPSPSCFFVFLASSSGLPRARLSEDLTAILERMVRGTRKAQERTLSSSGKSPVPGIKDLTSREREVLALLVSGGRVPEIARSLFLSQSTVRTHVAAAERKLGASGQQQLIELCRRHDGDWATTP